MAFLSKYGVARHIYIALPKAGSAQHAVGADWTPSAGDVKISKDGGASANVTNLPTAIAMGNSALWDFSLTATEMEAAQVIVTVADSATKAVDDTGFLIETYGHASGQHAFDLDTSSVAQTGDAFARLGAPAGASVSADLADIEGKVDDLETRVGTPADLGSGATVAANLVDIEGHTDNLPGIETKIDTIGGIVDAILVDTAEIGAAGAGLTNINLPNQTLDIVGNITGNLSGSVGSVTALVTANATQIGGSSEAADRIERSALGIVLGTCDAGSTTTAVIVSSLSPASAVNDQFKGRIVTFDKDTTTAALRGQSTDITMFDHATQTFTVTALTNAAASGDTFTIN